MLPASTQANTYRVRLQAEQSQPVSQEAVVSYAKELKEVDPDYRPPDDIPTFLR